MEALEELLASINDVRTIKSKRSARKGNLKRLSNYYHTLKSVPLRQLKIAELQKRLAAVEENATAYDLIQDRLEEVADEETVRADETEVLEQRRLNGELLLAYQDLIDAGQAWYVGGKLIDKAEDLQSLEAMSGTYARQSFERFIKEYEEFRQTIKKMPEQAELQGIKTELSPIVRNLCARMDSDLVIPVSADSSASAHSEDTSFTSRPAPSCLRLELPSFSGEIIQWKDFWALFSAVIDKEALSDHEKICHLQAAMKTEEAKSVVRHAASGGSYDEVVDALRLRYDKNRVAYMHHVSTLQNRGTIHCTYEDLVRGKQELALHRDGLIINAGETLDQFLVASTVLLMDATCAAHWANYSGSRKDPPGMDVLNDFFEHRLTILQANPMTGRKATRMTTANTTPSRLKEKSRSTVLHARETPTDSSCPACGEHHPIYQCMTFKSWPVERRSSTTRKKHLCFNCLGQGHSQGSCPSKRTCRECSAHHHTLLHKPTSTSSATESSTQAPPPVLFAQNPSTRRSSPSIIPRTALATVTAGRYQQKARVLLDTGATMSLITSRLANSLKARKIRSHTDITGLGGGITSSYQVEVNLGSAFRTGGETLNVVAHVVECITSDYPKQDLATIRQMPFLQGLHLADPEFGRSGRVDLLLGVTHCNHCTWDEVKSSPDRNLTGMENHFWLGHWRVGQRILQSQCLPQGHFNRC